MKNQNNISYEYLKKVGLNYLNRFDTTSYRLEEVLRRKIKKISGNFDTKKYDSEILKVTEYFQRVGYINDQEFTRRLIERKMEQGWSKYKIINKLKTLGIAEDFIFSTLDDQEYSQETAAENWARKNKIGKFRLESRHDNKKKDLEKLARQGFPYSVCLCIVEDRDDHY